MSAFRLDGDGYYRAFGLAWFEHGFGTRGSLAPVGPLATAKQIHSDIVLVAEFAGVQGEGDAVITRVEGLGVAVKTADCLPVLLADPVTRTVAAVHAGWRGAARNIVARTIERMGVEPGDLVAMLGPCIGPCCFEVGPEVVREFVQWAPELPATGKAFVDLPEVARRQLLGAGVRAENVYSSGLCTVTRNDEFYSFRKEREAAGRMLSYIRIV